jgi:hypothetical protein
MATATAPSNHFPSVKIKKTPYSRLQRPREKIPSLFPSLSLPARASASRSCNSHANRGSRVLLRAKSRLSRAPHTPCSLGLSATSQQYFSFRTNQPPATSQQYSSLRTNQHRSSATSQPNKLTVYFTHLCARTPSSPSRRCAPAGRRSAESFVVVHCSWGNIYICSCTVDPMNDVVRFNLCVHLFINQ